MVNAINKSEGIIVKDVIVYVLALLVCNVFMQMYLNEEIYDYVVKNISQSNLIPYAVFIIAFILSYILCEWLFKRIDMGGGICRINKFVGAIMGWAFVLLNGALLIKGFYNEENLFDGPNAIEMLHHENNHETVIIMILIMLIVVAVVNIIRLVKPQMLLFDKGRVCIYILAFVAAVIVCKSMYTPNSYKNFHSLYHSNAYYNSIYNYMMGEPRTELNGSVYGFYGMLLAPFVKLLGGTYTSYYYVIGFLMIVEYLCVTYAIVNLTKSNFVRVAGVLAMGVYNTSYSWSVYRQLIPHRILFACILVAFLVYVYKHDKLLVTKSNAMLYMLIGYVICMFGLIWNFETGIVYLIAYVAFLMMEVLKDYSLKTSMFYVKLSKQILFSVLAFLMALVVINIVNLCLGGGFVSLKMYLFPLMGSEFVTETLTVEYQRGVVAWVFIAALSFAMVGLAISKTKLVPNYGRFDRSMRDNVLFAIGVITLGQMSYYINRPAYGNLVIAYFMAVLMMCVICDYCLKSIADRTYKSGFMQGLCNGFACLLLAVMVTLIVGGINNYENAQEHRVSEEQKNMAPVEELKSQLEENCEKNTKAIGLSIPMIYSELGWNSQYNIIDFADIGLVEATYDYLSRELNNDLSEPILIESYALEKISENRNISNFYNRFTEKNSFMLYDSEIIYYVPK